MHFTIYYRPTRNFFGAQHCALSGPNTGGHFQATLRGYLAYVFTMSTNFFHALAARGFQVGGAFAASTAIVNLFQHLVAQHTKGHTPQQVFPLTIAKLALFIVTNKTATAIDAEFS